ncbi:hypothetical protein H4R21_003991 [Coemansia helicoidea]|uniref:Uncharacterized protein n=1 Tax=Coemansia helicoidea TaxID=1286919 RepID=A0ACC1KZW4_9FUNG|nr:hypothetical protein H4R21_003991 [Coemansia helicoidea]
MDRALYTSSGLPDIFEPDTYNGGARQMASLNMLLATDFDIERIHASDSPIARYSRRRIASCSASSQTSTVCSDDGEYVSAFAQSEEFLLLKDDCRQYPADKPPTTTSAGRMWRRSSAGKLRTMLSGILNKSKN